MSEDRTPYTARPMTVTQTSLLAYIDLKKGRIGPLQSAVLTIIASRGPINNRQIAKLTGIAINVVTPRSKELRESGLVIEAYKAPDPESGRLTSFWKIRN